MLDSDALVEGDLAFAVHAQGEGHGAAATAHTTNYLPALQIELDVSAAGTVLQATAGALGTHRQAVGDAARTVGTVVASEGTTEVGGGVGAEAGFVHLQAGDAGLAGADARRVVLEADGVAQVEAGTAAVAVLVGDRGHQFHQIRRRKAGGLIRPGIRAVLDSDALVEGDLAFAVHGQGESHCPAATAHTADYLPALQIELDVSAAGTVLQPAAGALGTHRQVVADAARTVGTVVASEGTTEVGGGVGAQDGFVHLQAGDAGLAGADARRVVLEADGVAQVEGGAAAVTVLVGEGRHQFHQVGTAQADLLIRPAVRAVLNGDALVEGHLAGAVDADGEGDGPRGAAHTTDHFATFQIDLDVSAGGNVLQPAGGPLAADLQGVGGGAGAVGAVIADEGTTEVRGGIAAQVGLVHLEDVRRDGDRENAGGIVLEADGAAQVEAGAAEVTVLVGEGRHQFHQVRCRKAGGLIRPGIRAVLDGQFLVEGHLAFAVHAQGEGHGAAATPHTADHLVAFQVELDVAAAGAVLQAAGGTVGTERQAVGNAAGTVGAVVAGEGTAEVGGGVNAEAGFVHLQAGDAGLAGADARAVVLEADELADVHRAAGAVAVLVHHGEGQADTPGAQVLGLVGVAGGVHHGALLVEGDGAGRVHAEGEDQLAGAGSAAFDHRAVEAQQHRLAGGGVHQAGTGVLHAQAVGLAAQTVGTGLHVEHAAEVGGGVLGEVGLVHLQGDRRAPGDVGADVVVVVVGGVGLVFPVLIAGAAGVLQVGAAGVQGRVTEQHVGAIGPHQRGAADEGLPLAAHQLKGDLRAIAQAAVGGTVGNEEEAGVGRVQAIEVDLTACTLVVHVGPDDLAALGRAVVALDVVAVGVGIAGVGAEEGHRGGQVQLAGLNAGRVVVDHHGEGAVGAVAVTVSDLVADVEGDAVLGAALRVHQRLQQVDCVGAGGRVGQHHGHQRAPGGTDGQGVAGGVPGGGDALAAQAARAGEFHALHAVGATAVAEAAAGAGVGTGHIARAAADAASQAFIVQHGFSAHVAGGGAVVLEAHGLADTGGSHRHVAVAIGHGDHGVDLAGEAQCVVGAAVVQVLQRQVLGHAEGAVLADGHGERGLPVEGAAGHPADHQTILDAEQDGRAVEGLQARVAVLHRQAEHRGGALLVLANVAGRRVHHRAGALGIAGCQAGAGINHAGEQRRHGRVAGVMVGGIAGDAGCGAGVLQAGSFVVDHHAAFHGPDGRAGRVVLEAHSAADVHFTPGHVSVAIGHGDHSLDQAGQVNRIVSAAGVGVIEGQVLGHAHRAIGPQGDGESCLAGSLRALHPADHQAVLHVQTDHLAISGGQARVDAVTAGDGQAEFDRRVLLVLAEAAAGGADQRAFALGEAEQVGADVVHPVEQRSHRLAGHVVVVGITGRGRGGGGVLQLGAFIVGHATAFHPLDAGDGGVVLEAHGSADAHLVNGHVTVAVGHGDHGVDLAGEADAVIATAGVRVEQRHVLGDVEGTVLADGHGKRSLTVEAAADDAAHHQPAFQAEDDGTPVGGGQAGIGAVATDDGQAQHRGSALLVLAGAAAGNIHHRAVALGIAGAGKVAAGVFHAAEQCRHGRITAVLVAGIAGDTGRGRAVLQAGAFIEGHAAAFGQSDHRRGAVVLEADGAADLGAGGGLVAVAVGDGEHRAHQAGQVQALVIAAAVGMTQGLVLHHAQLAGVRIDGNGEHGIAIAVTAHHQATLQGQGDRAASSGEQAAAALPAALAQGQGEHRRSAGFVGAHVEGPQHHGAIALGKGQHVAGGVGHRGEHRQRAAHVLTVRLQAGGLVQRHEATFLGRLQPGRGAVVVDGDGQRHGGRHVAVQVEDPHAEVVEHLIVGAGGVGVAVVEAVVGEGVGPVAGTVEHQHAESALHGAATGDVDPVAVDVQHLDTVDAVRRGDHQAARSAFGAAAGVATGLAAPAFAAVEGLFIHLAGAGHHAAGLIQEHNGQRRGGVVRQRGDVALGEQRGEVDGPGGEADGRVHRAAGFRQQHEGVAAAHTARATGTARARTGCGGLGGQGRVHTGLDGGLQLLNVGQFLLARGLRLGIGGRVDRRHVIATGTEHLRAQGGAAVAPQGQLTAAGQVDGHRTFGAGDQLLAGEDPVPFHQRPARSIACYREHLAYDLPDDTDYRSHESFLQRTPVDHCRQPFSNRASAA